ncbi:MAG TPA: hypothetical protein VGU01_00105 [Sphingomicrobium sp.]|nr:hypothetical protein [Sphingomicrobium sp.]
MTSNPSDLYISIAPVAAAFAGFGSIASGLGQRRGGDDARVDAMRLGSMLPASLSATLLALLPATLAGLLANEEGAVRVSAFVAILAIVYFAPISARRALRIRGFAGFNVAGAIANIACTFLALAAFALCLLAIPANRVEALYLLGLMGLLGSSVIMFSRVIASMLRPHNEGKDSS